MSLVIYYPMCSPKEIEYTIEVIFNYFLKVDFVCRKHEGKVFFIKSNSESNTSICIDASFFYQLSENGYCSSLVPQCVDCFSVPEALSATEKQGYKLPVIFGTPKAAITNCIDIGFDIFGTIFFFLSGFESLAHTQVDNHGRLIGKNSFLYKHNLLHRPVVDEYVSFLRSIISKFLMIDLTLVSQPKMEVTCDVDHPFYRTGKDPVRFLKSFLSDVVVRKSPSLLLKRIANTFLSPLGIRYFDPYNTFPWYLEKLKQYQLKGRFYFICDKTEKGIDGYYSIGEQFISELILSIVSKGHAIGVHSSYNSILSFDQISKERALFDELLSKLNIKPKFIGNRQHYLRWDYMSTPEYLNDANYAYDTSGTFPDVCGFKYGTSFEFPMWSLARKSKLNINQKPLIVMEASLLSADYMNLGYGEDSKNFVKSLFEQSNKYGGCFRILWHNSHLLSKKDKDFLEFLMGLPKGES